MPPKKAAAAPSSVFIVLSQGSIDSVHASLDSANSRVIEIRDGGIESLKVEVQTLVGGTITISAAPAEEKPKKTKPAPAAAVANDAVPKANTAANKTKTPAEQRAANAEKPKAKAGDDNLPGNVKALLAGSGSQLSGMAIIVTGVPPTLGRKTTEKLVEIYGGKLSKSLSKNTSFVVVGNEAGPVKLQKIEELGLKTVDEDEFLAMIEGGAGGKKRAKSDDDDEDGEDSEEEEKPAKTKKQKK